MSLGEAKSEFSHNTSVVKTSHRPTVLEMALRRQDMRLEETGAGTRPGRCPRGSGPASCRHACGRQTVMALRPSGEWPTAASAIFGLLSTSQINKIYSKESEQVV